MRPGTIVMRVALAAVLSVAPVLVLAGPAAVAAPVPVGDGHTVAEGTAVAGVSDLADDSDGDAVTMDVTAGNAAPVAEPDDYTLEEDSTLTAGSVLVNDSDADGGALSAVLAGDPSNGTLTFAADGTFVYTPEADFHGVDSFAYVADDGTAVSAPTTVTLTVTATIDRPRFDPTVLALSVVEDSTYTGQVTAINVDGRTLTYTASETGTPTGAVAMDRLDGAFTFTPERDFVGLAQVDVFACDTFGYCGTLLINFTVTDVPDAPVADDQAATSPQGGPVTGAFDVRDIDSQVLTFTVTSAPQRGTVTIDADMWTFVYTPTVGTSGTDAFTVEICDADGLCASATVTVTVTQAGAVPVATPLPPLGTPADVPTVPTMPAAATGAGTLPVTGGHVSELALRALGMVGVGGLLVACARRRVGG